MDSFRISRMIRLDSDHFRPICFILIILHEKERTRCGEDAVWIFDSYSKGCVELWGQREGTDQSQPLVLLRSTYI